MEDILMSEKRFSLKEWEDLNYCEHCFYDGENQLSDSDVVVLLNELVEENEIKKEELMQKKLTNVLLAKIYVAQLSLNPHLSNPYVEDSLKKEMRLLDKKIRELCGDVFNE